MPDPSIESLFQCPSHAVLWFPMKIIYKLLLAKILLAYGCGNCDERACGQRACIWSCRYAFAYAEAQQGICKGDKVWQVSIPPRASPHGISI